MKDRPILFSAPMVLAILEGRKTQTRRIIKPQPNEEGISDDVNPCPPYPRQWLDTSGVEYKCPFGERGSQLWLRETFCLTNHGNPVYRADFKDNHGDLWTSIKSDPKGVIWKPSIFMLRKYSRIQLEITDVRVQRLQDISEKDAQAEGVIGCIDITEISSLKIGREGYRALWESINGPGSWALNPWVWAISFRRI